MLPNDWNLKDILRYKGSKSLSIKESMSCIIMGSLAMLTQDKRLINTFPHSLFSPPPFTNHSYPLQTLSLSVSPIGIRE